MEDASPRDRAAVVVESLAAMDSTEIAETVINISGYQVLQHISGFQVLQHISGTTTYFFVDFRKTHFRYFEHP